MFSANTRNALYLHLLSILSILAFALMIRYSGPTTFSTGGKDLGDRTYSVNEG